MELKEEEAAEKEIIEVHCTDEDTLLCSKDGDSGATQCYPFLPLTTPCPTNSLLTRGYAVILFDLNAMKI